MGVRALRGGVRWHCCYVGKVHAGGDRVTTKQPTHSDQELFAALRKAVAIRLAEHPRLVAETSPATQQYIAAVSS